MSFGRMVQVVEVAACRPTRGLTLCNKAEVGRSASHIDYATTGHLPGRLGDFVDDAGLARIVAGGRGRGVVGVAAVAGPPAIGAGLVGSERVRGRRPGAPARAHYGLGVGEDRRVAARGVIRSVEREGDGAAQGAGAPREVCRVTDRPPHEGGRRRDRGQDRRGLDRESTRLNSSDANISYAVVGFKNIAGPPAIGPGLAG